MRTDSPKSEVEAVFGHVDYIEDVVTLARINRFSGIKINVLSTELDYKGQKYGKRLIHRSHRYG